MRRFLLLILMLLGPRPLQRRSDSMVNLQEHAALGGVLCLFSSCCLVLGQSSTDLTQWSICRSMRHYAAFLVIFLHAAWPSATAAQIGLNGQSA